MPKAEVVVENGPAGGGSSGSKATTTGFHANPDKPQLAFLGTSDGTGGEDPHSEEDFAAKIEVVEKHF